MALPRLQKVEFATKTKINNEHLQFPGSRRGRKRRYFIIPEKETGVIGLTPMALKPPRQTPSALTRYVEDTVHLHGGAASTP